MTVVIIKTDFSVCLLRMYPRPAGIFSLVVIIILIIILVLWIKYMILLHFPGVGDKSEGGS